MTYNFDQPIERRGTDSMKWRRYAGRDVVPLWVADMDFAAPPAVLEAMRRRLDHGVFGYAEPTASVTEAIMAMLEAEYGWRIEAEWLVWTPGLAVALNLVCRMLETPGAAVVTSIPVYAPFRQAPRFSNRALREEPLLADGGRYVMDFDRLEAAFAPPAGVFLFCHPQNPTGRVWSRAELERLAALALRRGVLICSDEVHGGLVLDTDKAHIPLATLAPEVAAATITLLSPSKTYNIAGLMCAFAIIPNRDWRRRFRSAARGLVTELNPFGYVACEAAYRHGRDWRRDLLAYLRENRDLVERVVGTLPGLRLFHVEATYLAWIDCRGARLDQPAASFERAGVGLSDGAMFGAPGFVRLNFGCTRATLGEGLARMSRALEGDSAGRHGHARA